MPTTRRSKNDSQTNLFIFKIRIITVHTLYVVYSSFLWLKLIDLGVATGHQKLHLQIAMVTWMVIFVLCQLLTAISGLRSSSHKFLLQTWVNFPMLVFVVFNLFPYGFTLKHMYSHLDQKTKEGWAPTTQDLDKHNCTTMKNTSITSSRVPMYDFILLQLVMLVMLLTFIVYPLPRRAYSYSEYIAVGVEFINAFDTMDMISDLEFVQNYGLAWEIVFYISLGVTAVHIAFPIKVENEDMVWAQNITITSQSSTMHTESSVDGITNTTMEGGSHYSLKSILDAPIVFETDFAVQTVYTDGNLQTRNISIDATDSLSGKKNRPPSTNAVSPKESKQHHEGNNDGNLKRISTKFKKTALERYAVHFSETQKKTIKVFLTVVCTDLFFALIRFKIMMEEHSAVHGFNMFVKNLILFCFHSSYLLQHVHSLIRTKLLQDIERERSA